MSTNERTSPAQVASALVRAGLVEAAREHEAARVVGTALGAGLPEATSLRRRMAEIAGYVGGAFVVGAAALFLSHAWDSLGLNEQVALLTVTALVLIGVGAVLTMTGGGFAALRNPVQSVRRRLASVLFTGAALSAAGAVGLPLARADSSHLNDTALLAAATAAAVVALLGYLAAPSVVGQLGIATSLFLVVPGGLQVVSDDDSLVPFGLIVIAIGVLWIVLSERAVWRELEPARVIGCSLALIGAQIPIVGDHPSLGYVATAAVALAAFAFYAATPAWPYLASGVLGATLAVPEALSDWVDGSVGSAGILLATGVTLLVASLLGLRLRKEVA